MTEYSLTTLCTFRQYLKDYCNKQCDAKLPTHLALNSKEYSALQKDLIENCGIFGVLPDHGPKDLGYMIVDGIEVFIDDNVPDKFTSVL